MPQIPSESSSRSKRRSSSTRKSVLFFGRRISRKRRKKPHFVFKYILDVFSDKPSAKSLSGLGYLSIALSFAFYSLLALFSVSVVFSLFPIRFSQPDWYLRQFASFAEAAPLLIAAFSFAVAAVLSADSARNAENILILLRRIIRPLVIALLLLLPLQLVLGARFANRNYNANRAERNRLAEQGKEFILAIRNVESKQKFRELLLKRGIGIDLDRFSAMSLPAAKAQTAAVINQQINRQLVELKSARQRRLLADLVDITKLFISWISLSSFFIVLQRVTKSMSLQAFDQLRRRRSRNS